MPKIPITVNGAEMLRLELHRLKTVDRPGVIEAIVAGRHDDPFSVLGPHEAGGRRVVRAFVPGAESVDAVTREGALLAPLARGATCMVPRLAELGLAGSSSFDPSLFHGAVERYRPHSLILLPQMLRAGTARLQQRGERAPASLRQTTLPLLTAIRVIRLSPTATTSSPASTGCNSLPPMSPASTFQASSSATPGLNSTSSAGFALSGPALNQPPTVLHPVSRRARTATAASRITWLPLRPRHQV